MGEKTVQRFYDEGLLADFADIYDLHSHRERLIALEGFKDVSVDNLLAGIEQSKERPWPRCCSRSASGTSAPSRPRRSRRSAPRSTRCSRPTPSPRGAEGVGPVVAESVREFLDADTNLALLERLRAAG